MIWIIPLLLLCLFLLFRFVSPYESVSPPLFSSSSSSLSSSSSSSSFSTSSPVLSKDGFIAPLLVSPEIKKEYQSFREFYEAFLTRWKEALVTAYSLEQSPTEAGTKEQKNPSDGELNQIVAKLIGQTGKPLPSLPLSPLPPSIETLEDMERGRLLDRIPTSSQPYMDALDWMNQQFLQAQKELNRALQGGSLPSMEGFVSGTCAELATCFKENPDLIRQLGAAQQEEAGQRLERIQRQLMERFQQFQQPRLRTAFELNGRLREQAKETQRKAQTGEWVKDLRIPGAETTGPKPVLPPGGSALDDLSRSNPARYAEYQKSHASLFSIKQLMEQINRNLR